MKAGVYANGHFTPQYQHCHMCHYDYNYIGHLETLSEDKSYLLKEMGIEIIGDDDYSKSNLESEVSNI